MKKEHKNLLLTFLELATQENLLNDGISEHKKKISNLMNEIEKEFTGDKELFIQLEREILDVIELTQFKYFDYGIIANDIDENYELEYDPFKTLAE